MAWYVFHTTDGDHYVEDGRSLSVLCSTLRDNGFISVDRFDKPVDSRKEIGASAFFLKDVVRIDALEDEQGEN